MLTNYLKIALRNLQKYKGYSFINIAGLATGMAACVLILLFVRHEFSYDRYHEHAGDIYRVYMDRTSGEEVIHWARTPAPLAPALADAFPEIRAAVRVRKNPRTDLVRYGDKEFYEARFYFADSNVRLKQVNPATALRDPHSVVITEAMARKYFGDEDPVGQVLTFENTVDFTVTGVLEDVPSASHFVFDFLASFESLKETLGADRVANWAWVDHHTYVLASDGCLMEGLNHEAIGLAGHLNLGQMIVLWDDNAITIDGATDLSTSENVKARYEATGWHVVECDGHDFEDIERAIEEAKADPRPSLVACKTVIGKGAPNKQGTADAHGAALGEEEVAATRRAHNWDHGAFEIPERIYAEWDCRERGSKLQKEWETLFAAYRESYPDLAAELTRRMNGELPES
ncbi:MAG: ABC transporter permease, partial [Bacteroidetes bacterium]|nr:ABC transporter permease [Bacteroidota bacterium]